MSPCGNPPHSEADFYPFLGEVGKRLMTLHIIRANYYRLVILKTALLEECGDALLNPGAVGDKGGQWIVEVGPAMRPKGLVGNATMDVFAEHSLKAGHSMASIT
jgi:hypothetical protein